MAETRIMGIVVDFTEQLYKNQNGGN
jgi:hypothetical protein